jgi:hypothetical protein
VINSGIILILAYPETIVMVADEWYSPYLRYFGIGKQNYVRAGHAALVLINKFTGVLEYHDFGRYITSQPNGRVRGKDTDHELDFPIRAKIVDGTIKNLDEILQFLGTHPELTHGDGRLIASVCDEVDYDAARYHITYMQNKQFIRYAAFIKEACNCARFVMDVLIAGVTNKKIRRRLIRSTYFTPSTVGNVVLADTANHVHEVSELGEISRFNSSVRKENINNFLDKLENHSPNFVGTLEPKSVDIKAAHAQWLDGIAAGAWFEHYETDDTQVFRFKRISPFGNLDVEGLYRLEEDGFSYKEIHRFVHYSNCKFYHVEQNGKTFRFNLIEKLN